MPNKCENSSIDNKVESRNRVIIRQGITDPVAFDIQAVERIPRDPKQRIKLSALIGAKFLFEFTDQLSRRERHLWDERGLKSSQICKRMDNFIFEQARTLGWRLFLCEVVLDRISEWWQGENDGPELLAKLGKELSLGAKVIRGKARFPLNNPGIYQFKKDITDEVRRLLRHLKVLSFGSNHPPALNELQGCIKQEMVRHYKYYPVLSENLTAFLKFLELDDVMCKKVATTAITPVRLIDEFMAYFWNRDPESLRQSISRLGSQQIRK